MKKIALLVSLIFCTFYLGCSGRTPEPVLCYQPGDDALSCENLKIEMAKCRQEIVLKSAAMKERKARNARLICFSFLIYPLYQIDILEADEAEIQALNTRYNRLFMIALEKHCSLENRTMTIKRSEGREPTADDILKDELPSEIAALTLLNQ